MRYAYDSKNYKKALEDIKESSYMQKSQNRLLKKMEEAMVYDREGLYEDSRRRLMDADSLVDELYTESISKNAASFIYNDTVTDYSGEDYEKVAIHTMMTLSFISTGKMNEARVEARRINTKLNQINENYSKENEQKNKYTEDAFARYLAASIYEARQEWDDAIIDYARALELYKGGFSSFIRGGVPEQLVESLYRLYSMRDRTDRMKQLEKEYPRLIQSVRSEKNASSMGEILVLHDVGQIAHKVGQDFFLPIGRQVMRISFPVISESYSATGPNGFTLNPTGKYYSAENLADMNKIAKWCLEDRRVRMFAKTTGRLIVKGAATEAAYRNFGPLGGIAANVLAAATETADTRSWTLLPQAFFATRARVPAGNYEVTIKSDGKTAAIKKIEVGRGQLVILRAGG